MYLYNKKIPDNGQDTTLLTISEADSFNHLPSCPSRVISPLCLTVPPEFDVEKPGALPHRLTSDVDALHWFFKVVQQACKSFQTPFDAADFIRCSIDGPQYLSTRILLDHRKAWLDAGSQLDRKTITDVCLMLYSLVHDYSTDEDQVSDEARILFVLTGEMVEYVYRMMTAAYSRDRDGNAPGSDWPLELRGGVDWSAGVADILAGRFLDSGKCLYTYSRISDLFGTGIVFYMSQLEGSEKSQKHHACTLHQCYGHNINPETHRPAHVDLSCTCSMFDADLNTIARILGEPDLIPVMVFDEGTDVKVRVVPQTEVNAYIAVSYVASQIFASPLTNSLPSCQMRALRHIVRSVSKDLVRPGEICGIWIDTLHVPVQTVRQVSRDQALLKMKMTMEDATIVLIVDPVPAKKAATAFVPEEFMAYIVCSPWFSRLWTFSESQFASNLWVWYGGRARSIDAFLQQQGWPPTGLSWRSHDEIETIGRLRMMSRGYSGRAVRGHEYFEIIMEMLRHRQTSQPADEAFCLSMLMDLDTPGMLTLPKEIRMEFFYSQLRDVSAVLLIQSGERLTTPGFRWAPRTLLGRKVVSRYAHPEDRTIRKDKLGILVPPTYHACRLTLIRRSTPAQESHEALLTQRIYFRVTINSSVYDATHGDNGNAARQLLVMFNTTGDVHDPCGSYKKEQQPFQIPAEQFILLHRGWMRAGGVGPAVLLAYEDSDQIQVLDGAQEPETTRILTRYWQSGGFTVVTEKEEDISETKFGLAAAFDGNQPLDEHRAALSAEVIPLSNIELWIS